MKAWSAVIHRDAEFIWSRTAPGTPFQRWLGEQRVICLAPVLDPEVRFACSGPQTVEHVKDDLMMGRRAPDDMQHMVASCWMHNAFNPPSKRLRAAYREYLK